MTHVTDAFVRCKKRDCVQVRRKMKENHRSPSRSFFWTVWLFMFVHRRNLLLDVSITQPCFQRNLLICIRQIWFIKTQEFWSFIEFHFRLFTSFLSRCTNAKTVIKDFHKSDKPHDIYSHDGCIEIERNSISNSETDRTFTVIAELINMAEIHRSCSSYPSTRSVSDLFEFVLSI